MENVSVYKNGGVGCLNDMGTQEAALHAERWCWVVITRKPGELRSYVNGRLCAAVKLEARACTYHHSAACNGHLAACNDHLAASAVELPPSRHPP